MANKVYFKKCKTKKHSHKHLSINSILSKYQRFNFYVRHLGLNRSATVLEQKSAINDAIKQRNTDFVEYDDTELVLQSGIDEDFGKYVDRRTNLIYKECNNKTKTAGINIITGKEREFPLKFTGRDGIYDSLVKNYWNNFLIDATDTEEGIEKADVFSILENKGLLHSSSTGYLPWLYAVHHRIALTVFLSFVDDLTKYFIEIGKRGISCQEYLMRRIDGYIATSKMKKEAGVHEFGHQEIMEYIPTESMVGTNSITFMLWPKNWWAFETQVGILKTFSTLQEWLAFYSQNDADTYMFLMEQLKYFKDMNRYSLDLSLSLTLITLYKHRENSSGFSIELRRAFEKEWHLSQDYINRVAVQRNVSVEYIYNICLNLFLLPEYKKMCYLTLGDLLSEIDSSEFTMQDIKEHMSSILLGESLTHIFLPSGLSTAHLDNRPLYEKPLGKYKGYTLLKTIPNTNLYLCERDTMYYYHTLEELQQKTLKAS